MIVFQWITGYILVVVYPRTTGYIIVVFSPDHKSYHKNWLYSSMSPKTEYIVTFHPDNRLYRSMSMDNWLYCCLSPGQLAILTYLVSSRRSMEILGVVAFMYRDASHLWRSFSHNRTKINNQFLSKKQWNIRRYLVVKPLSCKSEVSGNKTCIFCFICIKNISWSPEDPIATGRFQPSWISQ